MKVNPKVGLEVECNWQSFTYRNSNVPSLNMKFIDGRWVVQPKNTQEGLVVYITSPKVLIYDRVRGIRITEVRPNVAFADALYTAGGD